MHGAHHSMHMCTHLQKHTTSVCFSVSNALSVLFYAYMYINVKRHNYSGEIGGGSRFSNMSNNSKL